MPIWVRDFSWEQTAEAVRLEVRVRGESRLGRDGIFCSERYLKVSSPPFLFEVVLFAPVDAERSAARIEDGAVIFTLCKKEAALWGSLALENGDRKEMQRIREDAVRKAQEAAQAQTAARSAKRRERSKLALEATMKLEEAERMQIEELKEQERKKATEEFEKWKRQSEEKSYNKCQLQEEKKEVQENQNLESSVGKGISSSRRVIKARSSGNMFTEKIKAESVPSPRPAGNIMIKFTPRVFPTALRESRIPEEEEWLCKQAEARRIINRDISEIEDLKEEEKNPDWLKDKGNKMFETGNYLAAVNAYNLAIHINNQIPSLFLNRAACHLRLRNLHKAVEDSSKALNLLTPPVPSNAKARVKAHLRRGTAFCELELYAEGLQDYLAALNIDPANKNVEADAEKIRCLIQGTV